MIPPQLKIPKNRKRNRLSAAAFTPLCDPGGARTLDPLIKSQLLYQLSYGVIVCSIATAKVLLFSKPQTILADFFEKKLIFCASCAKLLIFVSHYHIIKKTIL